MEYAFSETNKINAVNETRNMYVSFITNVLSAGENDIYIRSKALVTSQGIVNSKPGLTIYMCIIHLNPESNPQWDHRLAV